MGVFHFESLTSPTQYNLSEHLKQRGWSEGYHNALFKDINLRFYEQFETLFEYKHLLSEFIGSNCANIAPIAYTLDETNVYDVYEKIKTLSQIPRWILKPSLLNNGEGLKLLDGAQDLLTHYAQKNRFMGKHIVQSYIDPPHLLNGHKYSLRFFVVVRSDKKAYLYREGYFNVCRSPYNREDISQLNTHLTNEHLSAGDGIPNNHQIPSAQCQPFEPVYQDILNILKQFFEPFNDFIKDTQALNHVPSFILLGADFMLDADLNTYLLEFNHGPCFPTSKHHPLFNTLYTPFFDSIIDDFVLPIAFSDKNHTPNNLHFEKVI